jgi:hypothetical protein
MSEGLRQRSAGEPPGRGGEREAGRTADSLEREIEGGLTTTGELELVQTSNHSFDVDQANQLAGVVVTSRDVTAERVVLPFEEHGGLLSVILSKVFLLAADASIADPSITRQIRS